MNENLLRDFHYEEMGELKAIKVVITELEKKSRVTREEIAGVNSMIANMKSSTLGETEVKAIFTELSGIIGDFKAKLESQSINLQNVENLCTSIGNMKSNDSGEIKRGAEAINKASDKIDIKVGNFKMGHYATLMWTVVITLICGISISKYYLLEEQIAPLQENSIKYRYIKMKGEATPTKIAEIEDVFYYNRNPTKIQEIYKDVATFEEAVRKKAIADEQARLQNLESQRLSREANKLKEK